MTSQAPPNDREPDNGTKALRTGPALAKGLAATCFMIVLVSSGSFLEDSQLTLIWPPDLHKWADWVLNLHWLCAIFVVVPVLLSVIIVRDIRSSGARVGDLETGETPIDEVPGAHASEDRELWKRRQRAVQTSWDYEKERVERLRGRLALQALLFGDVASIALMSSDLIARTGAQDDPSKRFAYSIAAAATTAFLANLVRIALRISGGDITSRTFSWAIRSLVLVIVADLGLCALIVEDPTKALLLGIFVGATGDHAIQFLLEKASKVLGTGSAAAQKSSPLLDIEGITDEHVERLAEEGIISIHDLAFVPTARLFLSTAYSLQQICNWQDRALLQVYVGKKSAEALADQMNIRGAIDLRAFAHDIRFNDKAPDIDKIKEALRSALHHEAGGLAALVESMAHDEVAMRIRCYWGAVVDPSSNSPAPHSEQSFVQSPRHTASNPQDLTHIPSQTVMAATCANATASTQQNTLPVTPTATAATGLNFSLTAEIKENNTSDTRPTFATLGLFRILVLLATTVRNAGRGRATRRASDEPSVSPTRTPH